MGRLTPGEIPRGFHQNRLTVVWIGRHLDGPVLTIERAGPVCFVVWREKEWHEATWREVEVVAKTLDFEINLSAAMLIAEDLMTKPAPLDLLPEVGRERRKIAADKEADRRAQAAGYTNRSARKTDDEKRASKATRQARWRENMARCPVSEGWKHASGATLLDDDGTLCWYYGDGDRCDVTGGPYKTPDDIHKAAAAAINAGPPTAWIDQVKQEYAPQGGPPH